MDDAMDEDHDAIRNSTSQQSYTTWAIIQGTLIDPRDKTETKEEVSAHIDRLYESGIPFFTKRAIRAFSSQQTQITPKIKSPPKDLTGARIEWKVKLGKTIDLVFGEDQGEKKYVYKEPGVGYRSRVSLKRSLDWYDVGDTAEPLCLMYRICQRLTPAVRRRESFLMRTYKTVKRWPRIFERRVEPGRESEACRRFKSILSSEVSSHEINKIVGLACGSLALPNNRRVRIKSLLVTDPMGTSVDREVLEDIGFEMIDDPRGWLEIDERSVVLSVAPNVPAKEIIAGHS
ncbi:hypothetical protein N7523_005522 [Penicillium sp. IBT 18751x]|nr:hypothetical protein N7523_005522 [Penicillium sp. IBT 18751x]